MRTTDPKFIVRTMQPDEVGMARAWAAAEGWNPGLHTGRCFYTADPGGFFVGELDGQPISCISCVAYDDAFGFVGLYIVRPEFRGRGYGLRTWRVGMAHLGTRNVGLDGVRAQQRNYERSGFAVAYHHVRYQGEGGGGFATVIDCGLFHVFSDDDRRRYVQGLTQVVEPGCRLFLMGFSDAEPGREGPRRVSRQELYDAFADGWEVESIQPAQCEVHPEFTEVAFSEGGPKVWFAVIRRRG
jgi:hypothetical protein